MEQLELSEIQGFLVRDYKEMPFSKYFLLQISDAAKAKYFLKEVSKKITSVAFGNQEYYLNIGFTSAGFSALGLHQNNVHSFTREFREGMVTPHRQRLLGDHDSNDPQNWKWGGPSNEAIHVVLMLFDQSEENLLLHAEQFFKQFDESGLKTVHILAAETFPDDKEHFGFRDSISQPSIIGSGVTGLKIDDIKPGEFVLGYRNEYNVHPDTPLIKEAQ